jgi:hypothetical protein
LGIGTSGREGGYKEMEKEGEGGRNIVHSCMNREKGDLLKLFQEWAEEGIKENGGVNSTKIHCKNICKCQNVPSVQQ